MNRSNPDDSNCQCRCEQNIKLKCDRSRRICHYVICREHLALHSKQSNWKEGWENVFFTTNINSPLCEKCKNLINEIINSNLESITWNYKINRFTCLYCFIEKDNVYDNIWEKIAKLGRSDSNNNLIKFNSPSKNSANIIYREFT